MQYISSFFKNTYEKCFNVSGLRIEKDPIFTSQSSIIRYILQVKHPGLLSVHLFKENVTTVEVGGQKIPGNFICSVVSAYESVNYQQLHELEALHFLHDILEAFEFLYGVLKLQIKQINDSSFSYNSETQTYIFIDLANICDENGLSEQDLSQNLFQLVNRLAQLNLSTSKKSLSKMLKINLFLDPSYQTYIEINKPGKLKDSLYLKELQALFERITPQQLFNGIMDKFLFQIKQDKEILKFAYHLLIFAVNIVLKQKSGSDTLQNMVFEQTCQIICSNVQSEPQLYIQHFLQLENLDKLHKSPAEHFTKVFIFFLEKRQQSSTQQQTQIYIMQLIQFSAQNLAKASILYLQHCNNNILQKLYNNFIYQIQFYAQDYKSLISWNLYLTINNLREYYDKNPSQSLGMSIQEFWKYKINEQCIKTLEQGTYDFIQALNLLNGAIPDSPQQVIDLKIPFIALAYVIQNINSVKSLHMGILSNDPKRREISKKLYDKCVKIGIEINSQQDNKTYNTINQEPEQVKQSIFSKIGNYTLGNKSGNIQQNTASNINGNNQQDTDNSNKAEAKGLTKESSSSTTETSDSDRWGKNQPSLRQKFQQENGRHVVLMKRNTMTQEYQPKLHNQNNKQNAWDIDSDESS